MRRIAFLTALLFASMAGLAAVAAGGGGPDGEYKVRAYFDNAGFLVQDEEIRIAGAKVGVIDSVDVTRVGEPVRADGSDEPGKAVAVLSIEDEAFQDFRADASCLIRPQSLLGEKYVDCQVTQPRAAGSEPPPPLETIPDGERGEGEFFLPLENNGKQVDLDLVNNITREPQIDRFRLILNDLGAGLAARGEDLGQVIERANPALKQTDRVLAILAEQNRGLAQLARDSDTVLAPLAREREAIASFINNANESGEAAAERRDDLARDFIDLPEALSEIEQTMVELRRFSDAGIPLANDLTAAAPAFTEATEQLGPFAEAGTPALLSLGDAAEAAGPDLVASNSLLKDLGRLGESSDGGAKALKKLFKSLRKTGGIDRLMEFILYGSNTFNGFDDYGHYLRATLLVTNCVEYLETPLSGCGANWAEALSAPSTLAAPAPGIEALGKPEKKRKQRKGSNASGGDSGASTDNGGDQSPEAPAESGSGSEAPSEPGDSVEIAPQQSTGDGEQSDEATDDQAPENQRKADRRRSRAAADLLRYLTGDGS